MPYEPDPTTYDKPLALIRWRGGHLVLQGDQFVWQTSGSIRRAQDLRKGDVILFPGMDFAITLLEVVALQPPDRDTP